MFDFFTTKTPKDTISIYPVKTDEFQQWYGQRSEDTKSQVQIARFQAKPGETLIIRDSKGKLKRVYYGISSPASVYDVASLPKFLISRLSDNTLSNEVFELKDVKGRDDIEKLILGWGLGCYRFDKYKTEKKDSPNPILKLPDWFEGNDVLSLVEGIFTCRDLVNEPPNKLGPQEMVAFAKGLAKKFKASITVVQDHELLEQNYPMIFTVGDSSDRRPALVDIQWGNKKHPKITLVGKGVCFDSGGLSIKPSSAMVTMKKDMGGAAHVLGLANAIMRSKLPVRLRVLVPCVENSISGRCFRPDDVYPTRKGITVEIKNTDAEGRLVLSDSLYEASSEKPDLLVDFATLTGGARMATGLQIPPYFTNREELEDDIKKLSFEVEDPVWPMPLWEGYRNELDSDVADIKHMNMTNKMGMHITAALFLKEFIHDDVPWIHLDIPAWSYTARPGRPLGGTDLGLRTVFEHIKRNF